ncbi:MAG TPA: cupin domain-containing protein [Steroidobacteraceae bacterium]|nr:cupin domain-containing protein [Steroidobacteraceae bacterium]
MLLQDAQRIWDQFLAPLTTDAFLDQTLSGGFRKLDGDGSPVRTGLLGPDPYALLGGAFQLAPRLTFHSANPSGPPPTLAAVTDAAEFRRRLDEFHARNYSVRFPELRPLSPELDLLARALEVLLHQPVSCSAFWSRGGMRAPVHHDDHDLIVVQLRGRKRWFLSTRPSALNNPWRGIPGDAPELGPSATIDVVPGDLLYLPRGTLHSVDSDAESLHVAIGFTPLTAREALAAALDHLSDLDLALRTTVGARLAFQLQGQSFERLGAPLLDGAARLLAACRTPGFLVAAMQRRSARAVAMLSPLPVAPPAAAVGLDTLLAQRPMAFCHLTANAEKIDFSYPGGHIYIHLGALEAVAFVARTARFRVRDIPGPVGDDVRLSLATRFLEIGFLELAPAAPDR